MKARIPNHARALTLSDRDHLTRPVADWRACNATALRELTLAEARQLFQMISWNDIRLLSFNCRYIEIITKDQSIRVAAPESEVAKVLLDSLQKNLRP